MARQDTYFFHITNRIMIIIRFVSFAYGGSSPEENWFPSVKNQLESAGLTVISEKFPDNDLARASFSIPFLLNDLPADENTILIGYSSSAIATMRLVEQHGILGSVLVRAYYPDLDMDKKNVWLF